MPNKIILIGYAEMLANLISAVQLSGNEVVGVLRHERLKYNPFILKLKDIFFPSSEYSFLKLNKIREIKAKSVNSREFKNAVLKSNADILIVASWGEKISEEVIKLPKIAAINCHPSLLPKYRGPNPYFQVIKNLETETGVTFHLLDKNYDTGPILAQAKIKIMKEDTGGSLKRRCCVVAKDLLIELLNEMDLKIIQPIPQDEQNASYQAQINEKDIILDFEKTAEELYAQIRGLSPWHSAYFPHKSTFFKIEKAQIIDNYTSFTDPKTIVMNKNNKIGILCKDKKVLIFDSPKLLGSLKHFFSSVYIRYFLKTGEKIN